MRYKNLTITTTLMCLSIVAVAGLVMMPISNGVCRLYQHGWTPYNNNTAANIMVTEDTKGASWQVYATVDAAGGVSSTSGEKLVYASIYTDPYNLRDFTEDKTFDGTGWVTAFRDNYTSTHSHRYGIYFMRHTHIISGDIDTNRLNSPYCNGDDSALVECPLLFYR